MWPHVRRTSGSIARFAQFRVGVCSKVLIAARLQQGPPLLLPAVQKQGSGILGMEVTVIARQALLYGHIIAFALALTSIIKEDVRLLRAKRIDSASLYTTAKSVKWLLLVLWITGVPMVVMDVKADFSLLLASPKLLAKLIVVVALTANGFMLHFVAFPLITGRAQDPNKAATIAATLGAVSTTSWFYASFVAVSRMVAPYFSVYDFVLLYLLALAIAVSFAILIIRGRFKLLLESSTATLERRRRRLNALLREIELATGDPGFVPTASHANQLGPARQVRGPASPIGNLEIAASNRKPERLPRVARQH